MTMIANFFSGCFSVALWTVALAIGCCAAFFITEGWDDHDAPAIGIGVVLGMGAILTGYGAWGLWP